MVQSKFQRKLTWGGRVAKEMNRFDIKAQKTASPKSQRT